MNFFFIFLDLSLKEYKLNEKDILKILTEVSVTRSEAEIVSLGKICLSSLIVFFRNWMKKILEKKKK